MAGGIRPGSDPWLFAICLSRVGADMVYIVYAAALPVLQRDWHLSGTAAGSIASSFQVAYAVSLMGCSELADRVGARRVFLLGTLASAGAIVVAVGLVYGFAALGDSPIHSTAITEVVAPAYRGAALALRSLAGYGAGAAAPLVFGAILDLHRALGAGREGWGWAFASLGLVGAGAVLAVMWLHRLPAARALTTGRGRPAVQGGG